MIEGIPRVNGGPAGGDVAWVKSSGLFYTRYPYPGERPEEDLPFYQQIYYHKAGKPDTKYDLHILGDDPATWVSVFAVA